MQHIKTNSARLKMGFCLLVKEHDGPMTKTQEKKMKKETRKAYLAANPCSDAQSVQILLYDKRRRLAYLDALQESIYFLV